MRKVAIALIVLAAAIYGGLVAYLYFNQRGYFFFPDGQIFTPSEVGLAAEVVSIPTGEGEMITGWYAQAAPGAQTILYLKGNTGSFSSEYGRYGAFLAEGYGLLAFDYRGFPLSAGVITQDNILADALAAYDWLAERAEGIVVWGWSLGASPAVRVASERPVDALLLETPFYSAADIAAERYPYAPVRQLILDPFPTHAWIGEVTAPVFIAHGTHDSEIAVAHAVRLYGEAVNPYDIWIAHGAGHGDMWAHGLWARAQTFFEWARTAQ